MTQLLVTTPEPVVTIAVERGRGITLSRLDNDSVEQVGTFTSAAEAWAALDQLDAPEVFA